jgi:hypothetical protein
MENKEFITIFDVAEARGVKPNKDGSISMGAFEEVGLPMLGGCQGCGASIAAYNAYPTTTGFLSCEDCCNGIGFETVESFEEWSKNNK